MHSCCVGALWIYCWSSFTSSVKRKIREMGLVRCQENMASQDNGIKKNAYHGLVNQGGTCYLNSVVQLLFHISCFRQVVYQIPTEDAVPPLDVTLALQTLFYKLQRGDSIVTTKALIDAYGLNVLQLEDANEFCTNLIQQLEQKMQYTLGTDGARRLAQLFSGSWQEQHRCVNVPISTMNTDTFYNLRLVVDGCNDVYDSLTKLFDRELMEGEDRILVDGHGLQDAWRRRLYGEFPPILLIQLMRYRVEGENTVKINDRYEYPFQLNLGDYANPDADTSLYNYTLQSIVVHVGSVDHGHYYAYIKPRLPSDRWLKFDDSCVTEADEGEVLHETLGGDVNRGSAYLLLYIRDRDKDDVLFTVGNDVVPLHIKVLVEESGESNSST